jgi:hypothetical protein
VAEGRHYIRLGDGSEALFDLSAGDEEKVDLHNDASEGARLAALRAGLERVRQSLRARPQP